MACGISKEITYAGKVKGTSGQNTVSLQLYILLSLICLNDKIRSVRIL